MERIMERSCGCQSDDEYECYAQRYLIVEDHVLIEEDGGPCQCLCHEEEDRGEEYDENSFKS